MRIVKLVSSTDFKAILESKVDINMKIAKILTNAINWKFDFTGIRGSKVSFTLPIQADNSPRKNEISPRINKPKPMTDVLNLNSQSLI